LMWLIALAVPIQGSAAVTMFGCGPGHHGGAVSSQTAMSDEHEHEPEADLHPHGAASQEVDTDRHEADASFDHSHAAKPGATVHKVSKGACTPCASCGVVAALPATVIQFEAVPHVDFFVPLVHSGVSSFLADGLERPPRLPLA
jgi:hypothetical protein